MGATGDALELAGLLARGTRGFAAIGVLTTLVGGIPRVAQIALAVGCGVWSSIAVVAHVPAMTQAWQLVIAEFAIGAALGIAAAIPLLAARTAGRITDLAVGRDGGPYEALFGLLAAVVFVGIDGHVAVLTAIADSHRAVPVFELMRGDVIAAVARLVPAAIRLAIPWLVTAAVVQVATGVGSRLAGRATAHVPNAPAVPAAVVMMTAALVGTVSVAMVAIVRGTL